MEEQAIELARAAEFFRLLSDASRLRLLAELANRPRCVGELVAVTGAEQPAVSHNLKHLRDAGLVSATKTGRKVEYRLEGDAIRQAIGVFTSWAGGS